jgi:hypothetical protein
MSNARRESDKQDSTTNDDLPEGSDTVDNTYATGPNQTEVPVLKDETPVERQSDEVDPDSDEVLGMLHSTLSRQAIS